MFIKTIFPSAIGHSIPFKDAVDFALNAGFSGYWFNPDLDFTIPAEETAELIKRKHIVPMGMELPVEFRKDEETFLSCLEKLEGVAEYARYIGIKRCVTWIVPFHSSLNFMENFSLHTQRLGRILDVLKKYDISLGLEFQGPKSLRRGAPYWFIHTLDGVMALISALGRDNCGVLMDSWHWQLAGENSFEFGEFENGSQIVCVHVNDAPEGIREEDYEDLRRELPGATGILDIRLFLSGVEKAGYSGPIIAEPFCPKLASMPIEEAFRLVSTSLDNVLSLCDGF